MTKWIIALLAALLVVLGVGCSFSTLEDDRDFLIENQRHTTNDGGVTRGQLTRQLAAIFPEYAEVVVTIGDEQASDAEKFLAAAKNRASKTGVGSVDETMAVGVGLVLTLLGAVVGPKFTKKGRFGQLVASIQERDEAEKVAKAIKSDPSA